MFTFWFIFDSLMDSEYNLYDVYISLLFSFEKASDRFFSLSLNEIMKIIKLKNISNIWIKMPIAWNLIGKKDNNIIAIVDLINTLVLKTAIIEKECNINFKIDIFEGPKYLMPLDESISLRFIINFFKVPEKLLHKDALEDKTFTWDFFKQL